MSDHSLELASYIVTALATLALAFVGITQIVLSRKESRQRSDRLRATATYYAMLIRRSLVVLVRNLREIRETDNMEVWRSRFDSASAGLGNVANQVEQMALAAIEIQHGNAPAIDHILRTFYDGSHQVNEMASRNWMNDLATRQGFLDTGLGDLEECVRSIEKEFTLGSSLTRA